MKKKKKKKEKKREELRLVISCRLPRSPSSILDSSRVLDSPLSPPPWNGWRIQVSDFETDSGCRFRSVVLIFFSLFFFRLASAPESFISIHFSKLLFFVSNLWGTCLIPCKIRTESGFCGCFTLLATPLQAVGPASLLALPLLRLIIDYTTIANPFEWLYWQHLDFVNRVDNVFLEIVSRAGFLSRLPRSLTPPFSFLRI